MSGGIDELAATVRAGLDQDERIARDVIAGEWSKDERPTIFVMNSGGLVAQTTDFADARHIVRHDPERVLAEVAAKRAQVDLLLAEQHQLVAIGGGFRAVSCGTAIGEPCDCGRDERVAGYLALLAAPYTTET